MKFIIQTISLPAKKNDILFSCKFGRPIKYKSDKLREFEKEVSLQLLTQIRKYKLPIETPVEVYYKVYLNHRFMNRDVDNIATTLSDMLEENKIIKNDALVMKSIAEKFLIDKTKLERAEIEICEYLLDKN